MPNFKRAPVAGGRPQKSAVVRKNPLTSLRDAEIMSSKPLLPAEILATIVNYLAVADLVRFARVSKRMQEMVYDDARWVQRLKRMGVWNEAEARRRAEPAKVEAVADGAQPNGRHELANIDTINGKGRPPSFGASNGFVSPSLKQLPPARRKSTSKSPSRPARELEDGFDAINLSSPANLSHHAPNAKKAIRQSSGVAIPTREQALTVLKRVQSIRGQARLEYGKLYAALGRYYTDIVESQSPMQCFLFKAYDLPEQQAQMLAQLRIFAKSDLSPGASLREGRLAEVVSIFDTAALLEFRRAYESQDIAGSMRKYAHVLYALNGGQSSVDLFVNYNRLLLKKRSLGYPTDCIDYSSGRGSISLSRTQTFFDRLTAGYNEENYIIAQVFPSPHEVSLLLLERVGVDILSPYLTTLFDEAHTRGAETYLRTVAGTFAQLRQFMNDLPLEPKVMLTEQSRILDIIAGIFEPHLDLYLAEELAFFKQKANAEVQEWSKALSEQAASAETFLMSNVNRQADKKDFMSSFKKVVMMPVNILPSFPGRASNKTAAKALVNGDAELSAQQSASGTSTPVPKNHPLEQARSATPSLPVEAPSTELEAKAAIMNTKLENIQSLFSIEVALNLVHAAKSSLERAAQFVGLGNMPGEAAKHQCSAIYVLLLQILGVSHVKAGFDKAVDHLSTYNAREANTIFDSEAATNGQKGPQVAPLTTFLELVNVGDLIQQMLDVFYESELIRLRISIRDDFLDPAVKEKKKFETMLDERVAAGLGKGIDVLMDEVEFICGTTQLPSDFNPASDNIDIGPTPTARKVIDVVGTHTSMLTGSTDKTLLDVFSSEVGLRLFTTLTKHLKRQRVSTLGALPLLSDLSAYAQYIAGFKNSDLNSYFTALREVGQIYLIEEREAKEMAMIIADGERYRGVFTVEEVLEFAERRADWLTVRVGVEKAMYGQGCLVM